MGALAAHHSQYLPHVVKQVTVVNWFNQLDVAEMSGTVDLGAHASFAEPVFVHCAHQVIIDSMGDGVTIVFIGRLLIDLRHREASHILFRKDRER